MFTITRYFKNKLQKNTTPKPSLNTWMKFNGRDFELNSDIMVRLNSESRLDVLAQQYLGDSKYWWMICLLNNMKHFWDWKIGKEIRVPVNTSIFFNYITTNIDK